MCIRISEFEKPVLQELRDYSSYLWIDTFNGEFWISEQELIEIKKLNYTMCFVSPELHIPNIKRQMEFSKRIKQNIHFFDENDYICTKDYKIYSSYW